MSRLCTSFRLGLEKLDDRRCLSGTAMETVTVDQPLEEAGPHVRVFSGVNHGEFSAYGGFSGGVRVGAVDRDGEGVSSFDPSFTGGVFVAAGDLDGGDLGNDWLVSGTGQDAAKANGNLQISDLTSVAIDPAVADGKVLASDQVWSSIGAGLDVLIGKTGGDRLYNISDESLGASSTTSSHTGGANFLFGDGSVTF